MAPTDAPPPDLPHRHGRGRKQNNATDESLRVRRERNRQAQNALRRRKQAAQQAIERHVIITEETVEKMAGVLVEFADEVLQSEGAKLDSDLIQKLQRSMQRALALVKAPEESGLDLALVKAPEESGPDLAPAVDGDFNDVSLHLIEPGPPPGLETQIGWPPWNRNEASNSTPASDAAHPPAPVTTEGLGYYHSPAQNVFGDGWLGYLPPTYTGARDMGMGREGPSESLSMKILLFTMRRAYFSLIESEILPNGLASSAFEFSLPHHSREEILFTLRWFLGPGSPSLYRLARNPVGSVDSPLTAAILHPSVDTAALRAAHGIWPQDRKPFLNAQNIERFLSSLGLQYIENDVLELSVGVDGDGRYLISYQDPYSSRQPFAFLNLDVFFPYQDTPAFLLDETSLKSPGIMRIRISQTKFLHNLSNFSLCLAYGPAFPRACLQQVIEASLINPITN